VGFFSKIFGGKKDTGELETQAPEKQEAEEKKPATPVVSARPVEPEPIPEEDRVPVPEPKAEAKGDHRHDKKHGKKGDKSRDDHKPTVFGMPAPSFTSKEEAEAAGEIASPGETAQAAVSGEIAVGEVAVGEIELGGSSEPAPTEAAGSMVVGGEETLGQTSSGEIELGEVSVAAPVVRSAEPEPMAAAPEPAAEPAPATPVAPASASGSGPNRLSGARPALLDEEEHADVDLFPKADKKDLRSSIDCGSCRHKLPVPYVGYPARITCPFCLNVNEYNM